MMCLLFDFFAAKIQHIYIHWEIVTKYLFPQKCCPSEDKLFIRNAMLSSQMAVFEDKFIPAPSRTRGCHCRVLFVRCSRVKISRKIFPGQEGCFPTICHQNGQFVGSLMSKSPQFYLSHRFGVLVCYLPFVLSNPLRVRQ